MSKLPRITLTREQADAVRWWTDEQPSGPVIVTTTEQPTKRCNCGEHDYGGMVINTHKCPHHKTNGIIPIAPGDEAEVGWWEELPRRNAMEAERIGWRPVTVGTVVEVSHHTVANMDLVVIGQEWTVTLTDLEPSDG